MKRARIVPLDDAASPSDAIRRIVTVRLAETLASCTALDGRDDEAIHSFRLACKRLRFTLERFTAWVPHAADATQILREVAGLTGESRDATLLMRRAQRCGAGGIAAGEARRRDNCVERAAAVWRAAFAREAFRELARYAGLLESRE